MVLPKTGDALRGQTVGSAPMTQLDRVGTAARPYISVQCAAAVSPAGLKAAFSGRDLGTGWDGPVGVFASIRL